MIIIIKVSVVVPIYNVEKYLNRCIYSIINQKLKEIEIILINDGSTDNSLEICKKYEMIDDRIRIIDKPNGGVSSARNAGINAARGKYIGFVDPDDWIETEMYNNMYEKISKTQSDICMCNYKEEYFNRVTPISLEVRGNQLKNNDIQDLILNMIAPKDLSSNSKSIMGSVWRLLIKKEFINQNNIRFITGIKLMQDLIFCINALVKCNYVTIDNGHYYHYCNNPVSAISSYKKDIVETQKRVFNEIEQILIREDIYAIYEQRMNIMYVNMSIFSIVNEVHKSNFKSVKQKLNEINKICSDNKLKIFLDSLDTINYTFRKKTVLFALRYELSIYLYLYYSLTKHLC